MRDLMFVYLLSTNDSNGPRAIGSGPLSTDWSIIPPISQTTEEQALPNSVLIKRSRFCFLPKDSILFKNNMFSCSLGNPVCKGTFEDISRYKIRVIHGFFKICAEFGSYF